jgi:copper resistance protein C
MELMVLPRRLYQRCSPRSALAVVGSSVVLMVAAAVPASAHAALVGTEPEQDATVADELDVVVHEFNEVVEGSLSEVEVVAPNGERVDSGELEQDDVVLSQPLGQLPEGGPYTVSYRVMSADGHPVDGEWTFTYDGPLPEDEDGTAADDADGDPPDRDPVEGEAAESVEEGDPTREDLAAEDAGETGPSPVLWAVAVLAVVGLALIGVNLVRKRDVSAPS